MAPDGERAKANGRRATTDDDLVTDYVVDERRGGVNGEEGSVEGEEEGEEDEEGEEGEEEEEEEEEEEQGRGLLNAATSVLASLKKRVG